MVYITRISDGTTIQVTDDRASRLVARGDWVFSGGTASSGGASSAGVNAAVTAARSQAGSLSRGETGPRGQTGERGQPGPSGSANARILTAVTGPTGEAAFEIPAGFTLASAWAVAGGEDYAVTVKSLTGSTLVLRLTNKPHKNLVVTAPQAVPNVTITASFLKES